jgi:hypothetical protein
MTASHDAVPEIHLVCDRLAFDQTVPRGLVHRTALSEVYVADSVQMGSDEYVLAVQVPRAHSVWYDRQVPYHDPLATAEAARQGVYVVVHRHLGVSPSLTFSLRALELRVADLDCYRDRGDGPLQGLLTLRPLSRSDHDGRFGEMAFAGGIAINGRVAMTLRGELVFFSRDDFVALRAYQRRRSQARLIGPVGSAVPLPAAAVGRRDRRNCLLAAPDERSGTGEGMTYPLVVDERHPSFFDHRYDHVPGPLIVEAYRQAAVDSAHRAGVLASPVAAVIGCRAGFTDFAELDAPAECAAVVRSATGADSVTVDVRLMQFDRAVSNGCVELVTYPPGTQPG